MSLARRGGSLCKMVQAVLQILVEVSFARAVEPPSLKLLLTPFQSALGLSTQPEPLVFFDELGGVGHQLVDGLLDLHGHLTIQ